MDPFTQTERSLNLKTQARARLAAVVDKIKGKRIAHGAHPRSAWATWYEDERKKLDSLLRDMNVELHLHALRDAYINYLRTYN